MPLHKARKGKISSKKKASQKSAKSQRTKTKKSSHPKIPSPDEVIVTVDDLIGSFQYEEAVMCCEQALKVHPNNLQLLETVGALHLELGNADKAYDYLSRAVEVNPDDGHSKYMYLGQLCEGEEAVKNFLKGIEILEKQLVKDDRIAGIESDVVPKDISDAYCAIAEIYLTDSCFIPEAEEKCGYYCQKAIDSCTSNPDAYSLKASYFLSKDSKDEAKVMILTGLSLWLVNEVDKQDQPNNAPSYGARINCAKILLEVEEYEKAFVVLEGLLKEDDEVVQVWYLMGWLHVLTDDADSAIFYLEQTKKLYSKSGCDDVDLLQHVEELLGGLSSSVKSQAEEQNQAEPEQDSLEEEYNELYDTDEDEESEDRTEGMDVS